MNTRIISSHNSEQIAPFLVQVENNKTVGIQISQKGVVIQYMSHHVELPRQDGLQNQSSNQNCGIQ